jgi:membrane associated rhomboid family serine protease
LGNSNVLSVKQLASAFTGGLANLSSSSTLRPVTAPVAMLGSDENAAVIPAQSERQALDWSLVLASQSIEVGIERPEGSNRWFLVVATADHAKALEAIRQFRLENRRWAWRQKVPGSDLIFHWGSLVWVMILAWVHALSGRLHDVGAFSTQAFREGQWWRAFTAVWLHADLGHLAANGILGALILGLAMARYGSGLGLLLAFLSGVAGNLAGAWVRLENFLPGPFRPTQDYIGVGASGMVMGAVGLIAAQSAAWWRVSRHATRAVLAGFGAGAFLFLNFGSSPSSDLIAHAGGFVAGLLLGIVASLARLERWNRPAGIVCVVLATGTWLMTLR